MSATEDNGGETARTVGRGAMREQAADELREEREERQEGASLQAQVENSLAGDTISLPLGGERLTWQTFNGPCPGHDDTGGEISRKVDLITETFDRMDGEDYLEEYEEEMAWVDETLAWSAEEEWIDAEWVAANLSTGRRATYLKLINSERSMTSDQIKKLLARR